MAGEGGFNVGRIFASIGWESTDKDQLAEWKRQRAKAEQDARKKVEQHLGFRVDEGDVERFKREADSLRRDALRPITQKVTVDYDDRGAKRAEASLEKLGGAFRSLFKQSALITAGGLGVQAMSAATAGATALISALAPLAGALGAVPALGSAAGQGMGVFKLATAGLGDGLKAASEGGKAWEDALKKLTPQQAEFIRSIKPVIDHVKGLQATAREGFLPGAERGILAANKNFGVLHDGVGRTSRVLGELAENAGKMVGSKGFGRDLDTQMRRNDTTIRRAGEGGLNLANALRHVTLAAGPLVEWMTRMGVKFTENIEHAAKTGRETGKLAHFFDETRIAISRVARIGADLAVAFFNIGKEGKPLGDHVLVNMVKLAEHFKDWTASAKGKNEIADYFRRAKAPLDELGRLVHDAGIDFVKLGKGDQIAPLIRKLRVDVLPAVNDLVDGTTKAFGPVFIDAVTEGLRLFTRISGSSGPLVEFTRLLGKVLGGINDIIDRVPVIGTVLSGAIAAGGIYSALRIAATLSGLTRVIRLLRTARGIGTTAAVAEGAGAAAGAGAAGAAGGAAARGGAAGTVAAVVSRFPVAAIATAIVAAMGKPLRDVIRGGSPTGNVEGGKIASQASAIQRFNATLERLDRLGARRPADNLARQFDRLVNASGKFVGSARDVDKLTKSGEDLVKSWPGHLERVARAWGRTLPQINRDTNSTFRQMSKNTDGHMHDIRTAVSTNVGIIRQRLGTDTEKGKEALAANFRAAARAVKRSMDDGKISTATGTREIRRLMIAALKQLGFTESQADLKLGSGLRHGQVQQDQSQRQPGQNAPHARGGWVRRAVGGWIGGRGMVSDDVVPIGDNALAAYGEYLAVGNDGRRAVLNRHQAPVADMALAAGGYRGLDQGADLSTIERALAPLGGLDRLFTAITQPHFLARGGRFAGGGIAGAVSAADRLERAHFPYHWGGGHQGTPAPFGPMDCSGAVSYVLQNAGVNIPTMVSGQLASAGRPGSGPLTVFANPTHTFMRIGNRYFGTSGTNPGGGAGWMPDPGAGYKARFAMRAFLPGEGGGDAGGLGLPRIVGPRTKLGGGVGALVQQGLDITTAGANEKIAAAWASMGVGTGDPGDPGPVSGAAGSTANVRSIFFQALKLAGISPSSANISKLVTLLNKENRGHSATITNPIAVKGEHATGFMQVLPSTFRANAVTGHTNINDPIDNAAASIRYQIGRYGDLVTHSPYARGGMIGLQAGGRSTRNPDPGSHGIGDFKTFAARVWRAATARMGSRGSMPRIVFTDRLAGGKAYAHFNTANGAVAISRAMIAALRDPRSPVHNYAMHALVHEFAHARQRASVLMGVGRTGHNMKEGGADMFAQANTARIMSDLGYRYTGSSLVAGYPREIAWVRKHMPRKWWQRDQFAARGGFIQRFAKGGKVDKLTKTVGGATAGLIRKIRPMQTDRSQRFDTLMAHVDNWGEDYTRWERRFNITDEELVDSDTGQVNVRAVKRKADELAKLIAIRARIENELEKARVVVRNIIRSYRRVITALRKSLRHAKKKNRKGIQSYVNQYEGRVDEWQGKLSEVGDTLFDTRTDLLELRGERKEVLGTTAEAREAEAADTGGDLGGDISGDVGGGGDVGAEPEARPPTALELAQGVAEQIATFRSAQTDLLRSFGANATTRSQAFGAGGTFSGAPDELALAAGLRNFGGAANLSGTLGADRGGPVVEQMNVYYQQTVTDPATHVQQLRNIVENGVGG